LGRGQGSFTTTGHFGVLDEMISIRVAASAGSAAHAGQAGSMDIRTELQAFNNFMLQLPGCLQCGSQSEYVRPHILRKYLAFLVGALSTTERQSLWQSMSNQELEALVADRNQAHQALPEHWSAATIGDFFGLPPYFVSMWACLWKGALDHPTAAKMDLLLARTDAVARLRGSLADYVAAHGMTPCPSELLTWHFRNGDGATAAGGPRGPKAKAAKRLRPKAL
jgi:hypothetical protein